MIALVRSRLGLLFVMVPFAVTALLAFRTMSLQYDMLAERRASLLSEGIATTARLLAVKLEQLGTEDLAVAQAAVRATNLNDVRDLTMPTDELTLIFKDGRRIYPPYSIMMVDQQNPLLAVIEREAEPLLIKLRNGTARALTKLVATEPGKYALLRCGVASDVASVCLMIKAADLMAVLRSTLGVIARDVALRVRLIRPDQRATAGLDGSYLIAASRNLSGLLEGWRLEALEPSEFDVGTRQALAEFIVAAFIISAFALISYFAYRNAAAERAATAERARLVAQLSHELRTPLANMRLYLDLIARKSHEPQTIAHYVDVVDSEVARLEDLSENAILAARGAVAPAALEDAVPDVVIRQLLTRYAPLLAKANCTMRFDANADRPCRFDRVGLERITINLLDNACKYASGAPIEVKTSMAGDRLRLSVRDHGTGLNSSALERLFTPLARGATPSARGFGIGLWTVKSLAVQNGGDVSAENANPGARFVVEIELRQPGEPVAYDNVATTPRAPRQGSEGDPLSC